MFWSGRADTEEEVDVRSRFGAGRRLEMAGGGPPGMLSAGTARSMEYSVVATDSPCSDIAFAVLSRNQSHGKWHICMP